MERALVAIEDEEGENSVRSEARVYVNRLSDWFFVFARWVTKNLGDRETLWTPLGKRQDAGSVAAMIRKFHENEQEFDDLA